MPKQPLEYNATLVERYDITARLGIFRVRPDQPDYPFRAGQYTVLGLKRTEPRLPETDPEERPRADPGQMIRRAYSICSAVDDRDLEFYISMLTSGELTPRLWCLQPNDRLYVGPLARGFFTLDQVPPSANILMLATGTGLSPYMSMLRSHAKQFPAQRIAVIHGARHSWDLGYRSELDTYSRQLENLVYVPMVSRPQSEEDWPGAVGRIQQWLDSPEFTARFNFDLDPASTHVFLCGNPAMIRDAVSQLSAKGFTEKSRATPGNLHLEKYW